MAMRKVKNEPLNTLGEYMRHLRRRNAAKLNLNHIAKVWGTSVSYVSAVENNEKIPNDLRLKQFAEFLGEDHELPRLRFLAVMSRPSVEIELEGRDDKFRKVMTTLAHRSDALDDEFLEELDKLLEKEKRKNDGP